MRAVFLSRIWLGIAIIFNLAGCVAPQPHDLIIPTLDPLPSEPAATPQPPAKKSAPEKKTTPAATTTNAATALAPTPVKKTKPEKRTPPATTLVVTTVSTSPDFPPPKPIKKPKPAPKVDSAPILIAPRTQAPTILPVPAPVVSETTPPEKPAVPEDTDSGSGFDNLELVDASLKAKLNILRVGSEPSPNNLLTVFAGVKNKTSHPLELEMQTIYKDQTGNELNHGSWIPVTLKSHEEKEYRSSAISTEATDFVVRIRNASSQKDQ